MARMTVGECRQTRRGITYCRFPYGVRFVGRGGMSPYISGAMGMPFVPDGMNLMPGFAAQRGRRGARMREGECRRTRRGVKFCKRSGRVRFVRG